MSDAIQYHKGNRQLQDALDSRSIADRFEEKLGQPAACVVPRLGR
jgi:hypothetical protein